MHKIKILNFIMQNIKNLIKIFYCIFSIINEKSKNIRSLFFILYSLFIIMGKLNDVMFSSMKIIENKEYIDIKMVCKYLFELNIL